MCNGARLTVNQLTRRGRWFDSARPDLGGVEYSYFENVSSKMALFAFSPKFLIG